MVCCGVVLFMPGNLTALQACRSACHVPGRLLLLVCAGSCEVNAEAGGSSPVLESYDLGQFAL